MPAKQTGHTPGPWETDLSRRIPSSEGESGYPVFATLPNGTMPRVANVHCMNIDEYERGADAANARLIAAAPELLEACKMMLPHFNGGMDILEMARAAILKAERMDLE